MTRFGIWLLLAMVQTVPLAWAQQGSIWRARADVSVTGSLTQIAPANSARLALVCVNTDSSNGIRVGDQTVSATRGMRVGPGSTTTITATGEISGFSESGTVIIACSEEIR